MYDQFEDDWTPKLPLQVYLQHLKHSEELDHITSRSKLHYLPDKKNYKIEKTSIGFDLANASTEVATQFNSHVSDDLTLQGIRGRSIGNAEQRRDHLLERLVLARNIRKVGKRMVRLSTIFGLSEYLCYEKKKNRSKISIVS